MALQQILHLLMQAGNLLCCNLLSCRQLLLQGSTLLLLC
jgi:hypothetical protein